MTDSLASRWAAKVCPRCQHDGKVYHLMMAECDECIGTISRENDAARTEYVQVGSLLIPSPKVA